MNRTLTSYLRILLAVAFLALSSVASYADKTVAELTGEDREMYDMFRHLLMNGTPEEFYSFADEYAKNLHEKGYMMLYYKLLSNKGFYALRHNQMFRAIQYAKDLDQEVRKDSASEYYYLATGLYGDVYSSSHDMARAERYFKQALEEAGDRDVKFSMRVYLHLAEMLCMKDPQRALEWAEKAITTSKEVDNIDYLSMSLAMKAYIYYIIGDQTEFFHAYFQYTNLRKMDKPDFNYRYDNILEVAKLTFDKKYDAALAKAKEGNLAVDSALAVVRIYALKGDIDKGFEAMKSRYLELDSIYSIIQDANFNHLAAETDLMRSREEVKANKMLSRHLRYWLFGATAVFLFIYIMGRRRLMKKIWARGKELKDALARAEESDRMKSTFIKSISHEVRTPLNAVAGFTEVICSPDNQLSDDEKRDMQVRISSNVNLIASIINELLEFSKSESEKVVAEKEMADVWVNNIGQMVIQEAKGKQNTGVVLQFETDLPDDFKIRSNTYRLKTAVAHLVDNAIKFTEKGSVVLRCELQDNHVRYIVTDTGCGIKEEDRERIFENFHKGDDFKVGVGLGLSISRRMLQTLGGDVWLDTTYTNGARFIISLPCGG